MGTGWRQYWYGRDRCPVCGVEVALGWLKRHLAAAHPDFGKEGVVRTQDYLLEHTDWRYLIVLDACRPDVFAECVAEVGLRGRLVACDSQALDTMLWYRRHWSGPEPDVGLIGAHPYPWRPELDAAPNFGVAVPVWADEASLGWGGVVHPARLCEVALRIMSQISSERWIVHFEQPHLPYIGGAGMAFLRDEIGIGLAGDDWIKYNPRLYDAVQAWGRENGWERLRWYYKESLLETMVCLRGLVAMLPDGLAVITADHAEHIGEGNIYGHPRPAGGGLLRRVPWLEVL